MRHSEYTVYFRSIAEKHIDIRHSDKEMHFARIILERDPLGQSNLEEFLNALKTSIRWPFMLLEAYDHEYQDNISDNFKKQYNGAFIIMDKPANQKFDTIEAIYDRTEQIGEEILGYCIQDFAQKLHFRRFFVDECSGEKISNVAGFYGTRFNFSFTENANKYLIHKPEKFTDGN